jgi:hypothetical protein
MVEPLALYLAALRRVSSEPRATVGVDQLALNDVDVSHSDQGAGVLSLQESSGKSTGPHVDALAGVLGDRGVDDHVGDPAGPQGRSTRSNAASL